jgi:hypothetical protein
MIFIFLVLVCSEKNFRFAATDNSDSFYSSELWVVPRSRVNKNAFF